MKLRVYIIGMMMLSACNQHELKDKSSDKPDSLNSVSGRDSVRKDPLTIKQIQERYNEVQHKGLSGKLDSLFIEYDCSDERSGKVSYYFEQSRLLRVKHEYSEFDHFSGIEDYYLSEGSVYFIFTQETSWSFVTGKAAAGETKDDVKEQRIYLLKNKAIRHLETLFTKYSDNRNQESSRVGKVKKIEQKAIYRYLAGYKKLLDFKDAKDKNCFNPE